VLLPEYCDFLWLSAVLIPVLTCSYLMLDNHMALLAICEPENPRVGKLLHIVDAEKQRSKKSLGHTKLC
jgi:hypothetical protein